MKNSLGSASGHCWSSVPSRGTFVVGGVNQDRAEVRSRTPDPLDFARGGLVSSRCRQTNVRR